jgi:AcrR family transcriptional regulator
MSLDVRPSARTRLLDAADQLFYDEGVRTVGIDRIIERAGVAKASLYSTFGSKDELVRAYLVRRHEARQRRLTAGIDMIESPRDRLLAVFDVLAELFATPGFRGCAFLNASAEAQPGSAIQQVASESRAWVRSLLVELASDVGAADPPALAAQLVVLYDGATVGAQMDHVATAATVARHIAELVIDASIES